MRVFLADDQPQVRSALRLLLDYEPKFEVVGEAASSKFIIEKVKATQPDLLLFDWELPSLSPTDLLSMLRKTHPHLMVIALSGQLEAHQAALTAGVDAFISKGQPPEQLLDTLRLMNRGEVDSSQHALVKDWMTHKVVTIAPDINLFEAYRLMKENNVRRLPVVKEGRLVGIITRSDLDQAKVPAGTSPSDQARQNLWTLNGLLSSLKVAEIMTPDPITVLVDDTIAEAARLMQTNEISGLPVIRDEQHAVIGIITESDIFQMVVKGWNMASNSRRGVKGNLTSVEKEDANQYREEQ